jgi:hypothetical protein
MCNFNIPFTGSADSLILRAKQEIERAGGSFIGDAIQGNFQGQTPLGSIQGSYQVIGQELSISITKKPFLLSCNRIQRELEQVMQ